MEPLTYSGEWEDTTVVNCKISGLMTGTNGKFINNNNGDNLVIFEYEPFLKAELQTFAEENSNPDFAVWVVENPTLNFWMADYLLYTLPAPRQENYQNPSFEKTMETVLGFIAEAEVALGFYPTIPQTLLLSTLETYNYGLLVLGLVFNIILILFVFVAVLLIYSLLMITI